LGKTSSAPALMAGMLVGMHPCPVRNTMGQMVPSRSCNSRLLQEEPNDALDPKTLGLLTSIDIEKGKPFAPGPNGDRPALTTLQIHRNTAPAR
jgi:hypothetical protein